jgi:hypothetical protein
MNARTREAGDGFIAGVFGAEGLLGKQSLNLLAIEQDGTPPLTISHVSLQTRAGGSLMRISWYREPPVLESGWDETPACRLMWIKFG